MSEGPKEHDWKSCVRQKRTVGSNPTLSAKLKTVVFAKKTAVFLCSDCFSFGFPSKRATLFLLTSFSIAYNNRMDGKRIQNIDFFCVGADKLAVNLLGKALVRNIDGVTQKYLIAETECYMGVNDSACHACRGKTPRASALWQRGGKLYVHLIYGLYYMMNIVAGLENEPMGVLIRGVMGIPGPGKLTRALDIGKDFNREDLLESDRIWIEETNISTKFDCLERVGIGYANKIDREKLWRFSAYKYL